MTTVRDKLAMTFKGFQRRAQCPQTRLKAVSHTAFKFHFCAFRRPLDRKFRVPNHNSICLLLAMLIHDAIQVRHISNLIYNSAVLSTNHALRLTRGTDKTSSKEPVDCHAMLSRDCLLCLEITWALSSGQCALNL